VTYKEKEKKQSFGQQSVVFLSNKIKERNYLKIGKGKEKKR